MIKDNIEIEFTDGKEEYLKKLAEKESVNKRKSNIYTILFFVSLFLCIIFFVLGSYSNHKGICVVACLCCVFMCLFSKLDGKPSSIYHDAWNRQKDFLFFWEKYEKNQILSIGYGCLSGHEWISYDYEDAGIIRNGSLDIDKYEYRTDIEKTTLVFADEIIFKRKYYIDDEIIQ